MAETRTVKNTFNTHNKNQLFLHVKRAHVYKKDENQSCKGKCEKYEIYE